MPPYSFNALFDSQLKSSCLPETVSFDGIANHMGSIRSIVVITRGID